MKTLADLQPPKFSRYPGTVLDATAVYDRKGRFLAIVGFRNVTTEDFRPVQQGGDSEIIGRYMGEDDSVWDLAYEFLGEEKNPQWIIRRSDVAESEACGATRGQAVLLRRLRGRVDRRIAVLSAEESF